MRNKQGDFTGILFLVVSIAAFAIFLLIIGYITPQIVNPLKNQIGINDQINNSLSTPTSIAANTLPTIWMIMFGGLTLGLFATAFLIRTHPIFVPIFGFLLVVAILVAIPLSNAYDELSQNNLLDDAAAQQSLIGFIVVNLPFVTMIIGFLVLVITFAKPPGGTTLA